MSLLLTSCSSNPKITRIGPGVIKSEQQLISTEQLKKDETKKDVLNGSGIDAGSEVAVGAGSGAMASAMIDTSGGYIYVSQIKMTFYQIIKTNVITLIKLLFQL